MLLDPVPDRPRTGADPGWGVITLARNRERRRRDATALPPAGSRRVPTSDWIILAFHALAWACASACALLALGREAGAAIGLLGATSLGAVLAIHRRSDRRRWVEPIREILRAAARAEDDPGREQEGVANPEPAALARAIREMQAGLAALREGGGNRADAETPFALSGEFEVPRGISSPMLTRSSFGDASPTLEGELSDEEYGEMINRLDLRTLRWLDSSPAERAFLGWSLDELRERSFLDIVDVEDRELARTQLASAITKGEGHNLLYRIRTAAGELKAVELHAAVRYTPDARPHHLRIRVADMTKKVRAENELRKRTRELIDVNSQLRRINRELEFVKNRYSDLYRNAPAMYFSLDPRGTVVECNDTLLLTLGRDRGDVVGRPYVDLLPESRKSTFPAWFDELRRSGRVELESRWVKSDGQEIDVWLASTAVRTGEGAFRWSRSVARDVTARRALEAELKDKNERLAAANDELSRKNRELDEFTYIIAHDLKEPLRTLIAFSGFLEKDCWDRLDDPAREYLRHIVEAARRMRSLIDDLQKLSRAGRVVGEFRRVRLGPLIESIRDDFAELLRSRDAQLLIANDLPDVWGDPARIGQLFGNLIGNGLKYNREARPCVVVTSEETPPEEAQPGFLTLAVRDNGIGIEAKFHSKIFQLFRRLHTREEFEGTGAGLAIGLKIVQAHGGRIWVESEPGLGSTFFVNLPLPPDPSPPPDEAEHAP